MISVNSKNQPFLDHCGPVNPLCIFSEGLKTGHRYAFVSRLYRRHWGRHREGLRVASRRSVRPVPEADRLSDDSGPHAWIAPTSRNDKQFGRSSSPDAQLPVGLCAGWFGGVMTVVIGCTKKFS